MRDLPAVVWLFGAVFVALLQPVLPAPRWLMVHLLLLGAVSHSILVWSRHFTEALLHAPPRDSDRRDQSIRLALLNLGVVAVLVGVPAMWWPLTIVGAAGVTLAVVWHGWKLTRDLRRALPSRFGATVHYYVGAACFLPVGAVLGTALAKGFGDPTQERLKLAHESVNLLGWIGLTVIGTLVTFWPTMLRTRIVEGAERAARRALPVLALSVVLVAVGALVGTPQVAAAGLLGYLLGLGLMGRPFLLEARQKPPSSFSTFSVLAGLVWLVAMLVCLAVGLATTTDWAVVAHRVDWATPFLVAGFAAQVLLGALSYLVPMALGGGPTPLRAATAVLDKAAVVRVTLVNAALLVAALPVVADVRRIAASLVGIGLASFLPLLLVALPAWRRARALDPTAPRPRHEPTTTDATRRLPAMAATVAVVALAVGVGAALPSATTEGASVRDGSAGVAATGHTTTVQVDAANMRFTPDRLIVPAGNRLMIIVRNTDRSTVHDLVLDTGVSTGRLSPGQSARLDAGVVGRDIEGWCSVIGHRQLGMVLRIQVKGGAATPGGPKRSAAQALDFGVAPPAGFRAHDATLPPVSPSRVVRRTFTIDDHVQYVAPGVTQRLWTYNGSMPGPVLHGKVGDRFVIRLVNHGSMGHSIDFHAGSLAPDRPMRTIPPGGSLVYRFTAARAGVWMYHCSTMPMSAHIANGMFGAVVIDPPGLPPVDHSYLLVQSELYLGPQGQPVDVDKLRAGRPDAVVFNGYADQYDHRPLRARAGHRIRIWVLDAGPDRFTSFHVVGGQFATTYAEGSYLLRRGGSGGSQALALGPGQGGFVELTLPQPGHYPFVSHVMTDAERGAHGLIEVSR